MSAPDLRATLNLKILLAPNGASTHVPINRGAGETSTTFPPMPGSSMSASAPTPASSLSRAFDAAGTKSAPRVIRIRNRC